MITPRRWFAAAVLALVLAAWAPEVRIRPPESITWLSGGIFEIGASLDSMRTSQVLCAREEIGPSICGEIIADEMPAVRVRIAPFGLDQTEVSVAAYRRCMFAHVCNPPSVTPGEERLVAPELPVSFVTWADAKTYCNFAGGRLPTEAEWEFAARRGGTVFPWGNFWNPRLANHGRAAPAPFASVPFAFRTLEDASDGFRYLAPLRSMASGRTRDGIFHLAGNVAEWADDYYTEETYREWQAGRLPRGHGPDQGSERVIRGGSFRAASFSLRSSSRQHAPEMASFVDVGFRCAYDPRSTPRSR